MKAFRGGLGRTKSGLDIGSANEGDGKCVVDGVDTSMQEETKAFVGQPRSIRHGVNKLGID